MNDTDITQERAIRELFKRAVLPGLEQDSANRIYDEANAALDALLGRLQALEAALDNIASLSSEYDLRHNAIAHATHHIARAALQDAAPGLLPAQTCTSDGTGCDCGWPDHPCAAEMPACGDTAGTGAANHQGFLWESKHTGGQK